MLFGHLHAVSKSFIEFFFFVIFIITDDFYLGNFIVNWERK